MAELKFIKNIEILSSNFTMVWDKTTDAGSFSWEDMKVTVGIKSYDLDPTYTFSVLSHEIMEIILGMLGARYSNNRIMNNYLFSFDHQTFENAIQIHSQAFLKFIK